MNHRKTISKILIAYLIFLSLFPFVFTPSWENWKATFYAREMTEEVRSLIVEREKFYKNRLIPLNDFDALGKAMARPRIIGQIPILIIHALILLILTFGIFYFKNWARLGFIVYGFCTILYNLWFIKYLTPFWDPYYPDLLNRSSTIIGLTMCLLYLIRPEVSASYRKRVMKA